MEPPCLRFWFEYVSTIVAAEKFKMSSSSDDESSNSLCKSDLEALMASSVEGLLRGVCVPTASWYVPTASLVHGVARQEDCAVA